MAAESLANPYFSHFLPSHPALSRVSQISCLFTKGICDSSIETDEIENIAFIMVKVYDADGGHNNFAAVVGLEDGTVVFAKQGTTEKDYKGAVIDISGLKF